MPHRFAPSSPPVAERRPSRRVRHGIDDPDDLGWMRDHDDPALVALLRAEDAATDAALAPLAELRDRIVEEIRGRTQEDDMSVPHRRGAWWYRSRTVTGAAYPIHERMADRGDGGGPVADADAVVILDENALAEGHDHMALGAAEVSPDGWLLAYSVDLDGSEAHTLRVRDLRTGEDLPVAIADTSYGVAWSADSATLLYATLDASRRPWRVHTHHLGAPPDGSDDALVLEEDDDRFWVGVGASRSGELVVVDSSSATTSEVHLVDARAPEAGARLAIGRRAGVEVQVAHHGRWLYIVSNADGAIDFALHRAPVAAPDPSRWQTVLAHRPGVRILGVEAFARHLVVHLRRDGEPGLRVVSLDDLPDDDGPLDLRAVEGASHDVAFPVGGHSLGGAANEEWRTSRYRFTYQSLTVPPTVLEDDLDTGERTTLRRMPVLGGYSSEDHETHRLWATAPDGTRIPISLAQRRGRPVDGTGALVLYGYGAYEISMDPWFSIARLSLLDRGVAFAVAHVRGGGELGREWYEGGRLAAKETSFSDLVATADHLAAEGWCAPDRIGVRGGSAGGLLVGAALNRAPDRFAAAVAEVPFVDALNTILDPDAPLTATEWEEWGDPIEDPDAFARMRSYSPTENVQAVRYPAIYATAGLNDPRVGVHEAAIWVQRLRERAVPDAQRPVLLRVEMGAGHGGPTGRYDAWAREAEVLAFLLTALDADGEL